jgi:1-deoxy-D-xylulose-5-phosphate synthase
VVFALDRAGITGPDGASHHGTLDMALCLRIPGMAIFAPSSAQELPAMLETALGLSGPSAIRFARGAARSVGPEAVGAGLNARRVRAGDPGSVCIISVGKMLEAAEEAADLLAADGIDVSLWDARVVSPLDPQMIADAGRHDLIVTVEDGVRSGGAGSYISDAVADLKETRSCPPVLVLGIPTQYIPHGAQDQILSQLGLDGPGIAAAASKAIPRRNDLGS